MKRHVPATIGLWLGAAALGLGGCTYHERTVEVRKEPEYVMVAEAPPAVIVEPRTVAPTATSVWIDGYWHWDGSHYRWEKGHWDTVPAGYAHWVPASYMQVGNQYRYTPGHWERGR